MVRVAICLLLLVGVTNQPTSAKAAPPSSSVVSSEFIFETPPVPSCHASTIAETTDKTLVAAWFAGTAEGKPDVTIWVSRRNADGWSAPVSVADGVQQDGERWPCWNPILFQPRNADLMLFYKVGPSPSEWWGMLCTSQDQGRTWSAATRLPTGILGPIKNKPIQLANGDILCPSSTEEAGWRVHFERTSDLGKTWTKTDPVNDGKQIAAIQPSILTLGGDKLRALGRTRQKHLFQIDSDDLGRTWGKMTLIDLPNPNSGTDAVTLRDGRHMLIYNHTAKGRSPLNLAISKDGNTWLPAPVLEDAPGEYSYPAIIQTADGLVHLTYTWKRQRIKHAIIDPAKLQ